MIRRLTAALLIALSPVPLVWGADDPPPLPSASGGPITPDDIMKLRDMRDVALSPDGRTALFTVQAQMATFASPHQTIWSVPGGTCGVRTLCC
jgi:hypothetical protein